MNLLLDEALFVCFATKSDHCLVQAACPLQSSSRCCLPDMQEFGTQCYFHVRDDLLTASQFYFDALHVKMAGGILCAVMKPKGVLLREIRFNKMYFGNDEF